jgi:RNA polymerase sigma factor (TIGR02999 family)
MQLTPEGFSAETSTHEVTELLRAWSEGDRSSLEKLTTLVYEELHRLAQKYMRGERPDHTLQATALVHEAYVRLMGASQTSWQNRAHFFAVSAQVMRHILVDFARARRNLKRGGDEKRISLDETLVIAEKQHSDLVALDDALVSLAAVDSRKSRVVELRFFGGLSVEETAEVLKVSPDTVMRDWRLSKLWLLREMNKKSNET